MYSLGFGLIIWWFEEWNVDGDEEEAIPLRSEGKSSGTVLPFVGVACLGAILFGYHLGYD